MYGKKIISIQLLSMTEKSYDSNRQKKIDYAIKSVIDPNSKYQVEALPNVLNLLKSRDPYCYPYNAIVGFAEFWIDFNEVLINYILNGDNRKHYNREHGLRSNIKKFYPSMGHSHGGYFKEFKNQQIRKAINNSLDEVVSQSKLWKLYVDEPYYRNLFNSINYIGLMENL